MGKNIRKLVALVVALVMMMTCAVASALTVDVKLNLDSNELKGLGMPEEQAGMFESIANLISALGLKVTVLEDGAEVALSLKGEDAVKLGVQGSDTEMKIASTLFPSYTLTIQKETAQQMMQQALQNIPGLGAMMGVGGAAAAEGGEGTMSALPTNLMTYVMSLVGALQEAAVPGEPESGEWTFEGEAFDVKTPVNIDMAKITETFKATAEEMFKDEAVVEMINNYLGMMGGNAPTLDQLKEGVDEFIAHFPAEVTAEVYSNTEKPGLGYVTGAAKDEGKEEASYKYSILYGGAATIIRMNVVEQGLEINLFLEEKSYVLEIRKDEMSFKAVLLIEGVDPAVYTLSLFFNSENPIFTAQVTVSQDGERTLPLDGEGKTLLAFEAMQDPNLDPESETAQAVAGFTQELQQNGSGLLSTIMTEAPELMTLVSSFMSMGMGMGGGAVVEEAPAAE